MIDGLSVLGLITARGGSKGVVRKNVRPLCGRPVIAWTVEAGQQASTIDRLVLSTDDEEIATAAREAGCEVPFMRPDDLAGDDVPGIEPVLHAIRTLDRAYDYIALLQPTSPLRTAEDIDAAVRLCVRRGAPSCVSVSHSHASPYWMYSVEDDGRMVPLLDSSLIPRRQELPAVYSLNGAVYVARTDWLVTNRSFIGEGTVAHVMPPERSFEIDEPVDLIVVEAVMRATREVR